MRLLEISETSDSPENFLSEAGKVFAKFDERTLHFDGGLDRIEGAGELRQGAVARGLEYAAAELRRDRIEDLRAQGLQPRQGPGLVRIHHARITDDVSGEDRGEAALKALFGHGG